jgi:hypothetical protein
MLRACRAMVHDSTRDTCRYGPEALSILCSSGVVTYSGACPARDHLIALQCRRCVGPNSMQTGGFGSRCFCRVCFMFVITTRGPRVCCVRVRQDQKNGDARFVCSEDFEVRQRPATRFTRCHCLRPTSYHLGLCFAVRVSLYPQTEPHTMLPRDTTNPSGCGRCAPSRFRS